MKIAIFETEHFEVADAFIKIFDNGTNNITLFCYPATFYQLNSANLFTGSNINIIVKSEGQSKIQFIKILYKRIKAEKFDLVFLNTISNNFIFYAGLIRLLPNTRFIITVHNINSLFKTKKLFSLRRIVRGIGKYFLVKWGKEFNVLSPTLLPAIEDKINHNHKNSSQGKKKKIYCIPSAVYEPSELQNNFIKTLNITICGSIDAKRRDYTQALSLAELLEQEKINTLICLLGCSINSYGTEILSKIKSFKGQHVAFNFYEKEIIPQNIYNSRLQQADLLFLPLPSSITTSDFVTEVYGETMFTGSIADAVKYATPMIIPADLKMADDLEQMCIRYNTVDELAKNIAALQQPGAYNMLKQQALTICENYTIENIRKHLAGFF